MSICHTSHTIKQQNMKSPARFFIRNMEITFSSKEIDVICARCRAFVVDNNDIFAAQYLVFNEHIVFDGTKEYRIDRVMIDEANNKVWIVDYKTGEEKEQEQLDTYKKIVSELFIEKNGEYQIETRFVSF